MAVVSGLPLQAPQDDAFMTSFAASAGCQMRFLRAAQLFNSSSSGRTGCFCSDRLPAANALDERFRLLGTHLCTRMSGAHCTALYGVFSPCTNALHIIGTIHCTCYHRPKACLGRCIGDLCRGAAIRAGPEPIIGIRPIAGTKRRFVVVVGFCPHTACSKNPTRNCAAGDATDRGH